jgi:glycosyltransferase involved in cell wall biosynthesis
MTLLSVIVPCLNEEARITGLLDAIYAQDYSRSELEVLIADGLSTDNTRKVITIFQTEHPDLKLNVLDNPSRRIPAGLNLAIAASKGNYILRLDAHCVPNPDYLSRSIASLQAGAGWNVGGVWEIKPGAQTWIAQAIAAAAAHPLGVGDAFYRFTSRAQEVDTVPFGAFARELIEKIGPFDETLLANEDYEFNARIRKAGGKIWLDPAIRSQYFARATLSELARQYWRYGYWKWQMLRRYPETLKLRQAAPPAFALGLILLPLLSLLWPVLGWVFLAQVVSYASLLFGAALFKVIKTGQIQLSLGLPLAIATMHLSWGFGFLASMLSFNTGKATLHSNGRSET